MFAYPDINTRGIGKIRDSYANPRQTSITVSNSPNPSCVYIRLLLKYNKVLSITNDFLYPSDSKIYGKEPRCNEHMLPVPWPFVISRFHRDLQSDGWPGVLPLGLADGICGISLGLGNCPPTPPLT